MSSIGTPKYITVQQAEAYAAQAGFSNSLVAKSTFSPGSYSQIQTIVAIAAAESSLNVNAYNPTDPYGGSYGVLQINGSHFHAGGITQSGALDPAQAFRYAYTLSNHGTNYLPWGTFTNKSYLQHIPTLTGSATSLPKEGWWNYNRLDNYGHFPDPQGNYKKPDVNVLVPYGYPVTMPMSGIVSGINSPDGSIPPYGATVTIKLDQPLNTLATHLAFLHMADITVRLNQRVSIGTVVGHAGDGNHAAGSAPASLGVALTHGQYYGFGSDWQYNANADPNLNPAPFIDSLKTGGLSGFSLFSTGGALPGTGVDSLTARFSAGVQKLTGQIQLSPSTEVGIVFEVIDLYTTLISPVPDIQNDVDAIRKNPLNVGAGWALIGDLFGWLAVEMSVVIIRLTLIFLGAYVCFKVIDHVVNISGALANVAQTGEQVAKLAALG